MFDDDRRVFILRPIDGKKPVSSTGLTDSRLFSGENKLYAIKDDNCMWFAKYEIGGVPPVLKQKFTKLELWKNFMTKYFNSRNAELIEVTDA